MASDSFSYADDAALPSPWADANSSWPVASLKAFGGKCIHTGTWSQGGARYTTSTRDECTAKFVGGGSAGQSRSIFIRGNGTSLGYEARFAVSGGYYGNITVRRAGGWLGTLTPPASTYANSADHVMRIWTTGTSPVTVHVSIDGNEIGSGASDASPLSAGNPGFTISPDGATPSAYIDDWSDGASAPATVLFRRNRTRRAGSRGVAA